MSNHHSGTPAVYCIYFWNWEKWLQSLNDRPTEDERLASKTRASRAFLAAVFTREKTFQPVSCWLGAETTQMQSTATVSRLQWNSTLPGSENALGLTYRNIYLSGRHTFAVADWKCVTLSTVCWDAVSREDSHEPKETCIRWGWTSASSGHETEWSVRPRRCRLSLPLLWKLDNSVTALQETETITILTHYHHHHDKNHYHYSVYLHSVLLSIL